MAANTVVFYDKDWVRGSLFVCHRFADRTWRFSTSNPQMDLQAQAAHIGLCRADHPARHTIESKILRRTSEKRYWPSLKANSRRRSATTPNPRRGRREGKGWQLCHSDGSTGPLERRAEMDRFQQGADAPDVPRLFLLGTRAGGLSINMIPADTVVFYDQDWARQQTRSRARSRGAHRRSASSGCRLSLKLKARHAFTLAFLISSSHTNLLPLGQFKEPISGCRNAKAETPRTIAEMAAGAEAVKGRANKGEDDGAETHRWCLGPQFASPSLALWRGKVLPEGHFHEPFPIQFSV
ncbi:hypothetical protein EDB83DRAFT_2553146 [Lactarius deliciosus]|nr:hypothetical protein EDB83DRAFT_2553146 [Lactarius deliciosus]